MSGSLGLNAIDVGVAMDLLFGSSGDCEGSGEAPSPNPGDPGNPPKPAPGDQPGDQPGGPPVDGCGEPKEYTGAFFVKLAGAGVQVAYAMSSDDTQETLQFTGLTLGPDTAHLTFDDGTATEIASADLNKNASPARTVDAAITFGEGDTRLSVTKLLDVIVVHNLAVLASQMTDLPKALYQGTSQLTFDGAAKPTIEILGGGDEPIPTKPDDGSPPDPGNEPAPKAPAALFHLVDGNLTLLASAMDGVADVNISALAGQCLIEAKQEGEGETHPFATVEAGTCP